MLTYSKTEFIQFRDYFSIKDEPWNIENIFVKKANKYIKYLKFIPWIKMVAIWNSVAMNYANNESDIDLFIITSINRLWIVRILTTIFFTILLVRKTPKYHTGRFCLSFFCTTKSMDFSGFAIENDIYLYFWIIYLKPILDFDNTYDKFISAQTWSNFEEYKEIIEKNKNYIKHSWKSFWDKSKIINFFEKILKSIFIKKTIQNYNNLWKPFWIIINDNMLKFHNDDKRKEIRKEILD